MRFGLVLRLCFLGLPLGAASLKAPAQQAGESRLSKRCQKAFLLKGKLYSSDGSLRPEYIGQAGYAQFADEHFDGRMQRAFANVSAVSSKREMAALGWKVFIGTVRQFRALERDFIENYPEGWIGLDGQKRAADEIFQGRKQTAYRNVSVLRGYFFGGGAKTQNRLFQELQWSRHWK